MKIVYLIICSVVTACSSPKLDTNGEIQYRALGDQSLAVYPQDKEAQEKLESWIEHNDEQYHYLTINHCAGYLRMVFPNSTVVYFCGDSIIITPHSIRSTIRDLTKEDIEFYKYVVGLRQKAQSKNRNKH